VKYKRPFDSAQGELVRELVRMRDGRSKRIALQLLPLRTR
jgi:hypothetical protein